LEDTAGFWLGHVALQRPLIGKSRSTLPDAFIPAGRLCGRLDLSLRIPRLLP
jgi:hypothetical protein